MSVYICDVCFNYKKKSSQGVHIGDGDIWAKTENLFIQFILKKLNNWSVQF